VDTVDSWSTGLSADQNRVTPQEGGHCDANIKRLETGTFRVPHATAGRVDMTTADLAALLAGIDLDTARRRHRYTRPVTPLQNSEDFAPTNDHAST
jgi:transposase